MIAIRLSIHAFCRIPAGQAARVTGQSTLAVETDRHTVCVARAYRAGLATRSGRVDRGAGVTAKSKSVVAHCPSVTGVASTCVCRFVGACVHTHRPAFNGFARLTISTARSHAELVQTKSYVYDLTAHKRACVSRAGQDVALRVNCLRGDGDHSRRIAATGRYPALNRKALLGEIEPL